jgi:pimeloyl-ACP methyl ester carboxylesterase
MSEPEPFYFRTKDDAAIELCLHHYVREKSSKNSGPRRPVLLLHGASASHKTFTTPDGGLADWLAEKDFDPWLLDWRGSGRVVDNPHNRDSLSQHGRAYNFNRAARYDIPQAIEVIRKSVDEKVKVLGFCMGGAALAESVALGHITEAHVDCIVLMTLALFYEAPIDGRLKCEDRVLERQQKVSGKKQVLSIDPRVDEANARLTLKAPWPPDLDKLYEAWPGALKSHAEDPLRAAPRPDDPVNCMCNRLSFMYGMPYHHDNLVEAIHGANSQKGLLPELFGAIPLHMFIHGAQNIRRGHATPYTGDPDNVKGQVDEDGCLSEEAREKFRRLSKVTLITGALDRLWHRDSIDLMYEWLCRGTSDHMRKFKKQMLADYAHQDLLWGTSSREEVFPKIKEGLSVTG